MDDKTKYDAIMKDLLETIDSQSKENKSKGLRFRQPDCMKIVYEKITDKDYL